MTFSPDADLKYLPAKSIQFGGGSLVSGSSTLDWQNDLRRFDVDDDGIVELADADLILDALSSQEFADPTTGLFLDRNLPQFDNAPYFDAEGMLAVTIWHHGMLTSLSIACNRSSATTPIRRHQAN